LIFIKKLLVVQQNCHVVQDVTSSAGCKSSSNVTLEHTLPTPSDVSICKYNSKPAFIRATVGGGGFPRSGD
jgi:hypothetical protein